MKARALPIIKYRGKRWYFDERLSELRSVRYPWMNIRLSPEMIMALKNDLLKQSECLVTGSENESGTYSEV